MKQFTDNKGEIWTIKLTLGKVRQISQQIGLDLLNPEHYFKVMHSLTERLTFVFLLCEEKAKSINVNADDFEERLYGDGIAMEAGEAFLEECEVFFRNLDLKGPSELTKITLKSMKSGQARLDDMLKNGHFDLLLEKADQEMEELNRSTDGDGSQS